jgi:hypothetical protein
MHLIKYIQLVHTHEAMQGCLVLLDTFIYTPKHTFNPFSLSQVVCDLREFKIFNFGKILHSVSCTVLYLDQ